MPEEKEKKDVDVLEKVIKVYSILFMMRASKEDTGHLSFVVSKELEEIKKCFDFASTVMVPGDDVIKITLGEMTEKEFEDCRFILSEEQKQINERGMQ